MNLTLRIAKGKASSKEVTLAGKRVLIGRRTGCQLQIPSSLVSREHCVITDEAGQVTVQDLGSSNGTFVNGKRVKQKALSSGDTLGVGPLTFIVQLADGPSPSDTARPVAAAAPVVAAEAADDFVVAEDADEAADFVVSAEPAGPDTVHGLDVAALTGGKPRDDDDEVVVAELVEPPAPAPPPTPPVESGGEEADFVLAEPEEPASESGEADFVVVAEETDEPVAEPAKTVEPAKKKGGLFGWLGKGEKKKPPQPAAPAQAAATPAIASSPTDEAEMPAFAETDAAEGTTVGEDELADFLTGLNEKDAK
jgi:predicted component of type VI protein secretion system